jgi:hypothetical protein
MLWEALQNWFFGLGAEYNVNPLIFGALYVGTIPLFWLAVARVVKTFRAGKSILPPAFFAASCSLSSYVYVIFAGRNIPVWVYAAIILLVTFGAYSAVKSIRRKIDRAANDGRL